MNKFKQASKVGSGLLNNASQNSINPLEKRMDIVYVDVNDIQPNSRNFYSQEEVEKRKESIEQVGLLEPLIVRYSNKAGETCTYTLLSGENRWRAISELKESGKHSGVVPVIVKDMNYLEQLPLTDEEKEDLLIIEPNAQRRTNTENDMLQEVEKLTGIYKKLRRSGIDELNGQAIAGKKTRELIAEKTGMTAAQVEKYESINRNAAQEVKDAVGSELNVNVAREIVKQLPDEDQQREFMKQMEEEKPEEKITTEDVKKFKEAQDIILNENQTLFTMKTWKTLTKNITKQLKKNIVVDKNDYDKCVKLLEDLEKILADTID